MGLANKLHILLNMIKFEHTVFALPFAYLGMVLGAGGMPSLSTFIFVTLAMVGARTYAMALNRLVDRDIDSRNPRTARRALPRGLVSISETVFFTACSLGLFLAAVYMLPPLCQRLWPLVIIPMTFYSLAKRVSWACHFWLGLCLGLAPPGAWVAATNTLPPPGIMLLGCAVLLWTAGFDIIYSCQDRDFDRSAGIFSIPACFGVARGLQITKWLHAVTVLLLLAAGLCFSLGVVYYIGITVVALFLWYENSIISSGDLSRVTVSFFTMNGLVSISAFVFAFISLYV
jgi:4-hydroxybenzoate polyprenyltransferase